MVEPMRVINMDDPQVKELTSAMISMAQSNQKMAEISQKMYSELADTMKENNTKITDSIDTMATSITELTHDMRDVKKLEEEFTNIQEELIDVKEKQLAREIREGVATDRRQWWSQNWWKVVGFTLLMFPIIEKVYTTIKAAQ